MRVLAVDPGYDRLGIAVLEKEKDAETLLFSDCIQTNKEDPFSTRLRAVAEAFEKTIIEYTPDVFASEALFFAKNQKTAIDVASARGTFMYIAGKHNLPVHEYTPLQIKIAVTGYGRSDKSQVTDMVTRLIKIEKKIKLDDEYDAIAVGLTCLAVEKLR